MGEQGTGGRKRDETFDAGAAARALLRGSLVGTLATCDAETGAPYASLAAIAPGFDGAPLLLLSALARHTRNLAADARVSLLLDARTEDDGSADPMTRPRISLTGSLAETDDAPQKARYLRHHRDAALYAGFADFVFYRMAVAGAHLVAGFGRIVDLAPGDLLGPPAPDLAAAEEDIVAHLNADHAGALQLYARAFAGDEGAGFVCVACDAAGLTLRRGMALRRVLFPAPVQAPGPLRMTLKAMSEEARAAGA